MTKIHDQVVKSKIKDVQKTFIKSTGRTENERTICTESHQVKSRHSINSTDPLGSITSYSARPVSQQHKQPFVDPEKFKHGFKKKKIERKKKIGKYQARCGRCGMRPISKDTKFIDAVQGEKGGIYYAGMQRCGSVWFCQDCMYKLMKRRSEELYSQLKIFKDAGKSVLFITFTLQHKTGDSLQSLHDKLLGAFNFANSHKSWQKIKKQIPVEYLRVLEVLCGMNGWHTHLHCIFTGDPELLYNIKVFIDLYKQKLAEYGLLVNKHTVVVERWNGKLDDMKDYMFKGLLEEEIFGNIKKAGKGKSFFDLVDDGEDALIKEYVKVMKGKRQYHHSRGFFNDIRIQTNEDILHDDKVDKVLFTIPKTIYIEIVSKGIAMHLLNEYEYGGIPRAVKLLELYDVDTGFLIPLKI